MEESTLFTDRARPALSLEISEALRRHQLILVTGELGLGQETTVDHALGKLSGWTHSSANGNWLVRGYLAGFQELIDAALGWCADYQPEIITTHEQSIKRLFPRYDSPHFKIPKDLTNTSSRDERTRFYHLEYQNKLLVGISQFLLAYLTNVGNPTLLVIHHASNLSPTATSLLHIFLRNSSSIASIKFVLIDNSQRAFFPEAPTIWFPPYTYGDFAERSLEHSPVAQERVRQIYMSSRGNRRLGRALHVCEQAGIQAAGYLDVPTTVDLYLATLSVEQRRTMVLHYIQSHCLSESYIDVRNYETYDSELVDREHRRLHVQCLSEYDNGNIPLLTLHAWSIRDKFERLAALVGPSEILKEIGLYDTWFSFFGQLYSDDELRRFGSGNDATNATFLNAAFVLYSLGCAAASVPFLNQFHKQFSGSKFVPTALYAQSMTYARYIRPVDLPLAEQYAVSNLAIIEASFPQHPKYTYIKVFAENAYAYIKAKQGKFSEALELCTRGNALMQDKYGSGRYKLHQSILIYNTSQIYELVKQYDQAETQLRLAISYDPYYGEYHNDLGNLLSRMPNRQEEALVAYSVAIALCPPYQEAFLNRGMLQSSLGNYEGALADFMHVLEIKHTEWRALLESGVVYLRQGLPREALQFFRQAIELEPASADLECNMGLALSECGDTTTAISHYERAILLDSNHVNSHNNLAISLFHLGRLEDALHHASRAAAFGDDADCEATRIFLQKELESAR